MDRLACWKILQSNLVLDNQWCRVRQDRVELSNGKIIDDYFVNLRPDIALILPITQKQEIVCVRQYRHGVEQILIELPAGTFNPDRENCLEAARRELEEETGYVANYLTKIATLYDNPVKDSNTIHLFLAEGVSLSSQQKLDVTEDIEVILIPIQQVKAKILAGEICVAGSIAAIFIGLDYLSANK
jgi:ADP-ribose pyrophosphatase